MHESQISKSALNKKMSISILILTFQSSILRNFKITYVGTGSTNLQVILALAVPTYKHKKNWLVSYIVITVKKLG